MPVREEAWTFGPGGALVGILTEPGEPSASPIACVIPNAGLIHRIGPRRFSVTLARRLAEAGIPTLRFDLAGVGDSKHVGESVGARQRILDNMRSALDQLEQRSGVRRFVIVGICSGAVNGYRTALADERVVGTFMYDGLWYRSRWTGIVRIVKRVRALTPKELLASLQRRWRDRSAARDEEGVGLADFDAANPPKAEFVADVGALVRRGVKLCFVYGGGVLHYYSYADQFRDVFGREPFYPQLRCEFLPSLDHMLSTAQAQHTMQRVVVDWALDVAAAQPR